MRAIISLAAAAALAATSFAAPAFAGKSAQRGAPGANSAVVETITVRVFPDGRVAVNGIIYDQGGLPPALLARLNAIAAAGGGTFSVQTADPAILGFLAAYF